jgi:hypothetical protein
MKFSRLCLAAALFLAVSSSAQITTIPKQGLRENDPRIHALTNAINTKRNTAENKRDL